MSKFQNVRAVATDCKRPPRTAQINYLPFSQARCRIHQRQAYATPIVSSGAPFLGRSTPILSGTLRFVSRTISSVSPRASNVSSTCVKNYFRFSPFCRVKKYANNIIKQIARCYFVVCHRTQHTATILEQVYIKNRKNI